MSTVLIVILGTLGIIVVFAVAAFIFFRSPKLSSGMKLEALSAETIWSAKQGQSIPAKKIWKFLNLPDTGNQGEDFKIVTESVENHQIGGSLCRLVKFAPMSSFGAVITPWYQVAVKLPASIAGTIVIYRIGQVMRFGGNEAQLESIDFNKQVILRATSRQLAWQVFPPDFMDYFLRMQNAPAIRVDRQSCALILLGQGMTHNQVRTITEKVIGYIEKSGALEKKN